MIVLQGNNKYVRDKVCSCLYPLASPGQCLAPPESQSMRSYAINQQCFPDQVHTGLHGGHPCANSSWTIRIAGDHDESRGFRALLGNRFCKFIIFIITSTVLATPSFCEDYATCGINAASRGMLVHFCVETAAK